MKRAFEVIFLLVVLAALGPVGRAALPVFRERKILLPVIVAADAVPEEQAAAAELARVLGLMSGLTWPIRQEGWLKRKGFYVGRTRAAAKWGVPLKRAADLLAPRAGEIGPDGFRIQSHAGSLFIEGATPEATGYAVAWLLQYEAGVRWYVPGAAGESVPHRIEWTLPELDLIREPAYVSREISGLQTPEEKLWAWHNGLRGRLEFRHALNRVFTPEALTAHANWSPQFGGQRYSRASSEDQNWQPNLALPEVAEYAARQAKAAFAQDPALQSFSLGINDTMRFDQSAATRALVEPLRYFRGMPDYSPLVFTFMNRAAESLAHTQPNHYLGCLAYLWSENPPLFPVQRNVLPFVTTDRSQYYDGTYRAADLALMSRWGASGVTAYGLWEYAYGRGFLVPRMPLAALADSVREGWHRGARGYLAEVGPQWGFDAGKMWMLTQLLWTPERPVEELMQEFYHEYYSAAAEPMGRFFARCEAQWMKQSGSPYWLKYYYQEDQALLFPVGACQELHGLLTEAARAVQAEPDIAARVARTARAFAVTEAYVKYDGIRRSLAELGPEISQGQEPMLAELIRGLMQAEIDLQAKMGAASEGASPAMSLADLSDWVGNDQVPRLLWLAGQHDPAAPGRILVAAGAEACHHRSWRLLAELIASGRLPVAPHLVANSTFSVAAKEAQAPRFLYPHSGTLPAKWKITAMPTEKGQVELNDIEGVDHHRVLRIEGAWNTQLYQWIPVEPDCAYVATARVRGQSSAGNDSALFLAFRNESGACVGTVRRQAMRKGETLDWRVLVQAEQAPDDAVWVGIGIGVARQTSGDWLEVGAVELRGVINERKP